MPNRDLSKPKAHPIEKQQYQSAPVALSKSVASSVREISARKNDCAGFHYIADFWGALFLQDEAKLEEGIRQAAITAGATLLHIHLHKFDRGGGVTGVALLAESHISVHTWPEFSYAAFDIFMCGDCQPQKAVECLTQFFQPHRTEIKKLIRGKEDEGQSQNKS